MSDVVPILRCKCGEAAAPVDVEFRGQIVGTGKSCAKCLMCAMSNLAQVRPVFDAMIAAGVSRELANETMIFLLEARFCERSKRAMTMDKTEHRTAIEAAMHLDHLEQGGLTPDEARALELARIGRNEPTLEWRQLNDEGKKTWLGVWELAREMARGER